MVKDTVLRQIGNSAGITIPKEILGRLHVQNGDKIHLVETETGVLMTPYDPDFEATMVAYAEGAAMYRNALRELAK